MASLATIDARPAGDRADAGDDARAGRLAVVEAVRSERRELEERPARIDEALDPLAGEQLSALPVALDRGLPAAGPGLVELRVEILDQLGHSLAISDVVIRGGVEMTRNAGHAARLP